MSYCILATIIQIGNLIRQGMILHYFLQLNITTGARKYKYIGFVAWCALTYMGQYYFYEEAEMICFFINAAMIGVCFSNKKKVLLAYLPSYMFLSFVDELLAILFGGVLGFNPLIVIEKEGVLQQILILSTSLVILFLIKITMEKKRISGVMNGINVKEYLLLTLSLLFLTILTSLITYFLYIDESLLILRENVDVVLFFSVASAFLGIVIMANMILLVLKNKTHEEMVNIYHQKSMIQEKYYQMILKNSEEIRGFRHDVHFHIQYLNQQMEEGNYSEVKAHLNGLLDVDKTLQSATKFSGNSIIDAIISGTVYEKENTDITFRYKGKIREKIGIEDIDLITLLSNALENAVEACELNDGEKVIEMRTEQYKESI